MTTHNDSKETSPRKHRLLLRLLGGGVKIVIAVLLIGGAVWLFGYQMKTSPRAPRQAVKPQAKLVQIRLLQRSDCATTVEARGPVIPAQEVTLQPQVSGKIIEVSDEFIPGGVVHAGKKLVTIDRRDYEIAVEQRRANVANALKDLKVEQGNQAIARQEYELLGEVIADEDRELVLRQPQWAAAESALESAQAALQKAQLDLARCEIVAPFNAIIRDKHVDLGATVGTNSQLVTLMATDEAWIELKVEINKLKWIRIPEKNGEQGASVKINNRLAWGQNQFRNGRVIRVHGALEAQGRMAQLLVAVDDPFCLKAANHDKPKLLMGSYVKADIEGNMLTSVIPIKCTHLRDNDTVWIMDDNNALEVRSVQIAYRGTDEVFVEDGVAENEKLVLTDIAAPVAGMPLRLADANATHSTDDRQVALSEGDRQ